MNTKDLLKISILSYAVVFCINNNANAITHHKVNNKVFQHDIVIKNNNIAYRYYMPEKKIYIRNHNTGRLEEMHMYYSDKQYHTCADDHDEYNYQEHNCSVYHLNDNNNYQIQIDDTDTPNKFNELYKEKLNYGVFGDTITSFENEVRRLFGSDYKVITNTSDILLQYPENRIQTTKNDGTIKDFIIRSEIFSSNQLYKTLENNNMQLITMYKNYQWRGTSEDENGGKKEFNADDILSEIFRNNVLIITNGKNIICYDRFKKEIRIYQKLNYFQRKDIYNDKAFIKKFKKLGLLLQEKYKAENRAVKEVFGQNFELLYM